MNYFWELVLRDDTVIEIPTKYAEVIRKRIENGEPISLKSQVIPAKEVKAFRKTEKPEAKLLEEQASQAFREPLYSEVEFAGMKYPAVVARWVKKAVPVRKWDSYYAPRGYRKIGEPYDGMVMIAYIRPVHNFNSSEEQYCTPEESEQLSREENRE